MAEKHPMQPIEFDDQGVIRFKANAIVRYLITFASKKGCGLNELSCLPFGNDDWTQLAQLMGYSVSGAGDLSYFDERILDAADAQAAVLCDERARAAQPPADPQAPSDVMRAHLDEFGK